MNPLHFKISRPDDVANVRRFYKQRYGWRIRARLREPREMVPRWLELLIVIAYIALTIWWTI